MPAKPKSRPKALKAKSVKKVTGGGSGILPGDHRYMDGGAIGSEVSPLKVTGIARPTTKSGA